ncbi:methyl-accepting chemotaxis protein [Thiomicrorhabdus arctica]|uniref:methyl-accepting chemotaxis protein n=1 Tax=Thiomicrorhabdus arctica TaxID=131540 RepID=UPI00035E64DC|nr:methyl-accepting chemotaxis protein [Thiomicrorhabdus arctica]
MFCTKYINKISKITHEKQQSDAIVDAINRSMATIEFDKTGKIITANDLFLQTIGYKLSEIQGQHHQMFVTAKDVNTPEYREFWQALARGEFQQGLYLRNSKQGDHIWLQASYNPILDEDGQVVKVIKFATDLTIPTKRNIDLENQFVAINRALAVIEFDMQGIILSANDNFTNTVSYSASEIIGQPHSTFVSEEVKNSSEYKNFWNKLRQGEYINGTFKRLDKNGNVIWLEAAYNAILDGEGNPYKVVKYAMDVSNNDLTKSLATAIDECADVLSAISEGDLTRRVEGEYEGNLVNLKSTINDTITQLSSLISNIKEVANTVYSEVQQVEQGSLDLNERVQRQAAALEETSATMEEINASVQNNNKNAQDVTQLSKKVQEQATEGSSVMQDTIAAMSTIEESSQRIHDIVSLIDSIAFQTNLLALNAAVEAARAGEHGRGFAVVAGEVRSLAQKAADAAKDIKVLIEESTQRVQKGSELASHSGQTLQEITTSIQQVHQMMIQIGKASQEQEEGVSQVNTSIGDLDSTTQQNAAMVEETAASAEAMKHQSEQLLNIVSKFRMSQENIPSFNSETVPNVLPRPKLNQTTPPIQSPKLEKTRPTQAIEKKSVPVAAETAEWSDF